MPPDFVRSNLFTPADSTDMMRKAADSTADAITFDLEDAVPDEQLATARENLLRITSAVDFGYKKVGTRINGLETEYWLHDIETAISAEIERIAVPKIETAQDVHTLVRTMSQYTDSPPEISLGLETPRGIFNGQEIARTAAQYPAVTQLGFGLADYCRAIGTPDISPRVRDFLSHLTIGYAAIGGLNASASTHLDIDDGEGLREHAERAEEIGYTGMSAIHPRQLDIINEVFTPSEERVNVARELVDAFDASEKDSLLVKGVFLDTATVDRYRTVIDRYETVQRLDR